MTSETPAATKPHFTTEQAVAVSRAIGAVLRPGHHWQDFTDAERSTLREARLTLAGAMAVAIDEERQNDAQGT